MPDYEYTDINLKDFIAALTIYLDRLEREEQERTPFGEKLASWLTPSKGILGDVGRENIGERYNRIYAEILDAVDLYGLSPDVVQYLSSEAGNVFSTTLKNRASYEWQKQYKGDVEKWAEDVVKTQEQAFKDTESRRRWEAEFGAQQQWRQYGAEVQQWQMQTQAQERMREDWRAQQNLLAGKYRLTAERLASWGRPDEGVAANAERASIWASAKQEILGGLDSTRDWLKIQDIQQKPNPWAEERTTYDNLAEAREEVKNLKAAAQIIQKRQADPRDPLFQNVDRPDVPTSPEQQYAAGIMQRLHTAEDKLVEFTGRQAEERGVYERGGEAELAPTKPRGVATPAWLGKLEPTMGATVTKQQPTTPSGQAWGRLKPSEQQQWAGWVEWSGYNPQDIDWQRRQTLSQRKQGARWAPAQQRTFV